jgi:CheY-like chemotaxis protein
MAVDTTIPRPPARALSHADEAAELLAEGRETADEMELTLERLRANDEVDASLDRLRRDTARLRLLYAGTSERVADLLLQRLAGYLELLGPPEAHHLHDLGVFIDTLQLILAGHVALPADEAEFARSLPVMRPADVDDLGQLSVEVLLVDPQRTSARFVARELQACGFRVSTAQRSYEALELAARTRPDLVVAAAVIDEIDGPELAAMLRVAKATAAIPFALLTSYEPGHPALLRLPPGSAVIRRGVDFADDVARELSRLGVT